MEHCLMSFSPDHKVYWNFFFPDSPPSFLLGNRVLAVTLQKSTKTAFPGTGEHHFGDHYVNHVWVATPHAWDLTRYELGDCLEFGAWNVKIEFCCCKKWQNQVYFIVLVHETSIVFFSPWDIEIDFCLVQEASKSIIFLPRNTEIKLHRAGEHRFGTHSSKESQNGVPRRKATPFWNFLRFP